LDVRFLGDDDAVSAAAKKKKHEHKDGGTREDEEKEEDAHRDEILARIQAAEAEIDRGDYREYDEETIHELAKDVHERGLKKLAAERGKTGTRG